MKNHTGGKSSLKLKKISWKVFHTTNNGCGWTDRERQQIMRYSEIPRDQTDKHTCKGKVGRPEKSVRKPSTAAARGDSNESYDGDDGHGNSRFDSNSASSICQAPETTHKTTPDGTVEAPLIEESKRKVERKDRHLLDDRHLCHKATTGSIESLNDGCSVSSSFR